MSGNNSRHIKANQTLSMPRLGSIDTSSPSRRRRTAALSRVPKLRIRNVLIALIALFVIRNFLRNDYRREGLKHLKEGGMSEEELQRFFPKTPEGRRKDAEREENDLVRMKQDISFLMQEVKSLRSVVEHGNHDTGANVKPEKIDSRGEVLKRMDSIHLQKRKIRQEKKEKDDPDYKATRKI